jgi:two-component system phosphate regulon response regulator PhoB
VEQAIEKLQSESPDIIVLKAMLLDRGGEDFYPDLKDVSDGRNVPIIPFTEESVPSNAAPNLEMGPDGQPAERFSPGILLSGLKAELRRREDDGLPDSSIVDTGEILIDPDRFQAWAGENLMDLTVTEFRVLHLLARHPGRVFSRAKIISMVKGEDYPATDRSVDVQIDAIRKKIGEFGHLIQTVRGMGYRFKD